MVERQPSKLNVAGSNPVSRSTAVRSASLAVVSSSEAVAVRLRSIAHLAQSAEHVLGKDEVVGSIPMVGSKRPVPRSPFSNP